MKAGTRVDLVQYNPANGELSVACRERSCKWAKEEALAPGQGASDLVKDRQLFAQAEFMHFTRKHGVRKGESKKRPVGRPPKTKIMVRTYQWDTPKSKWHDEAMPAPEPAQPTVIKIKFCPHCGERLPNAIVE